MGSDRIFQIAICNDDQDIKNSLRHFLLQYLAGKEVRYQIDTYTSGESILSLGSKIISYSVVFFNACINELDAVLTVRKMREISRELLIVCIIPNENIIFEENESESIWCLAKDVEHKDSFQAVIDECMETVFKKLNAAVEVRAFDFNEGTRELSLEQIYYIEVKMDVFMFHVMEETMKVYTMQEAAEHVDFDWLGRHFIRIHQRYLVNQNHITDVVPYKAILTNGMELIIPRLKYQAVQKWFLMYQRRK